MVTTYVYTHTHILYSIEKRRVFLNPTSLEENYLRIFHQISLPEKKKKNLSAKENKKKGRIEL